MKLISSILIALFVAAALLFYVHQRQSIQQAGEISSITFQDIDQRVRNQPGDVEVNMYSRQLQGVRVRWSGVVISVENGRTVSVATNVFPADVQFDVSGTIASSLRTGQRVGFTGTVENVSDAETFPPMFHTYVVLKDVKLENIAP